jgi:hypothetical protein
MSLIARFTQGLRMSQQAQVLVDDRGQGREPVHAEGPHPAPLAAPARPLMVVYIAGDGRSGSTLLDRLIGSYPGTFSCGELGNLLQSAAAPDEFCACGSLAGECDFWRKVLERWRGAVPGFSEREYRLLQLRYERLRSLLRPFNEMNTDSPSFVRYAEYTRALFGAIAELSGASVIIDSSKGPARALALSRIPGLDLRMLHLVRDVRGVAYSLRNPNRGKPKEGVPVKKRSNLRFAGTWATINYFCEHVRPKIAGPNLFLRYEDYTADLDGTLARLADLLGTQRIGFEASASHLMRQGHQVAGNDGRMRPVQRVATDEAWRRQFGFTLQKGLYLLVLPLMLRYRYRL